MLLSDERSALKEATVHQYKTSKWEDYWLGRITARYKAYEVINKYDDNLNFKNVKAAENLCADICAIKRKWKPSLCSGADKMNQRQGINTK